MCQKVLMMITVFLLVSTVGGTAADLSPEDLIRKVDEVRIPKTDFSVDVSIQTGSEGGEARIFKYVVMMNKERETIVKTTYPPTEKGQLMLMKGRDFWVYLPNVGQPVRLPLSQRLTGEVSNGDIARMSFSEDYKPTLLKIEEDGKIAVLDLAAKGDWTTYAKIILWTSLPDAHPLKADFYTGSGILLKTAIFENYKEIAGAIRPTQLTFIDAIKKGDRSALTYSNMKVKSIPGKYFNKDYMQRMD